MTGYVRAEDAAARWDVSSRQIQRLCIEGRIEGAVKFGNTWAIPENAPKPTRTGEFKPGRKAKTDNLQMKIERVSIGAFTFDLVSCLVFFDGEDMGVRQKECDVLYFLMQNQGKIFSAEELYTRVWGRKTNKDFRTVRTTIHDLRDNLRGTGYSIFNKYGKGYYFDEDI